MVSVNNTFTTLLMIVIRLIKLLRSHLTCKIIKSRCLTNLTTTNVWHQFFLLAL